MKEKQSSVCNNMIRIYRFYHINLLNLFEDMNKIGVIVIAFWILVILYQICSFSTHPSLPNKSTTKLIKNYPSYLSNTSVILLVVDALRYDYHTQFKVIQRISLQTPSESFLVKCRVGSPTMTTQRIQSMMTGSQVYQLFDVPTSFFASKVAKDNIIDQLLSENRESMVLGDGTWIKLFNFNNHSTCNNSFDVHDFTTCDRHVYEELNSYLENEKKYSLLVGHFLALDHIGHSFSSIQTLEMRSKIIQISSFFDKLIDRVSDNTLLLVVGDHGMKSNGNHGGDSDEQKNTFLFGYKKNANFVKGYQEQSIAQSQIAATISFYLNLPLPANTMGLPIIDSLPQQLFNDPILLKELYSNLQKHLNQILHYHQKSDISLSNYQQSKQGYANLSSLIRSLSKSLFAQQNYLNQILNKIIIFVSLICLVCLYCIIYKQKLKIIEGSQVKYYKISSILLMIGVLVLFGSWLIIKISSTFLILMIMAYLAIHLWSKEIKFQKIAIFSFFMFMLVQIQSQNQSQYTQNIFIVKILQKILLSFPGKIIICIIAILNQFFCLFSKKKIVNDKIKNNFYWYFLFSLILVQYYLQQFIQITIIQLRWFIITASLVTFFITKNTKLLCSICLLFMRQYSILIYACNSIMINQIIRHNYSFIVGSLLSQIIWWIIGYRYEYSSILAADSFILSSTFHPILNGLSILLSQTAPFLLVLCLLNEKYLQTEDTQYQIISESQNCKIQFQEQRKIIDATESKLNSIKIRNWEFLAVTISSLCMTIMFLEYNKMKILFTVVFVPMYLFILLKAIVSTIVVFFFNFVLYKKQI